MENQKVLGVDIPFSKIDGEVLKMIGFASEPQNLGPGPYGYILVESAKLKQRLILPIFHRLDFTNIHQAFEDKTQDQEVLIVWTINYYRYKPLKYLSCFFPKTIVLLCKKAAYDYITDSDYRADVRGEARYLEEKPIREWKPPVMS